MKRLLFAIFFLSISSPLIAANEGRFQIIQVQYDIRDSVISRDLTFDQLDVMKRLNTNHLTLKIDTDTGKTWYLKPVNEKGQIDFVWVDTRELK